MKSYKVKKKKKNIVLFAAKDIQYVRIILNI